jgi:hypothetical protein
MSEQSSKKSNTLASTETKTTAVFIVLGLLSALGTMAVTDTQWIHSAVLLGVGVVVPTLINEWRD